MSLILSGTNGLSDVDGSAATPAIRGTDTNTGIFFPAADTIAFSEGGTEAARFDSSGNLGLGVTPSAWGATGIKALQVVATTIAGQNSSAYFGANWYGGGFDRYINSAAASLLIQTGGAFNFLTAPSGTAGNAISFTQAMTLDASGNLLVGTTSTTVNPGISLQPSGRLNIGRSNDDAVAEFYRSGTRVGQINVTTTATSYITSSDYRLKEAIAPMTGALDKVALLKPCTYKWKADNSDGQGFIAHELAEVCPHAVSGEKDAVETVELKDEEGNVTGTEQRPAYQGIDTSFLVATLTAAIQELNAKVEAQAAEIAALKGQA